MKKTLLTVLSLLFVLFSGAQDLDWMRNESVAYSITYCNTTDKWGNNFSAGFTIWTYGHDTLVFGSDTVRGELFIVKYDSMGNFLWGAGGSTAAPLSIETDQQGNVYVLALNFNFAVGIGDTILENDGMADSLAQYFVAKYDANGHFLWAHNLANIKIKEYLVASPRYTDVYYNNIGSLAVDNSGNFVVTCNFNNNPTIGTTTLLNKGSTDIFLGKFDPDGNPHWVQNLAGNDFDFVMGMTVTPDNHIYLVGGTKSPDFTCDGGQVLDASDPNKGELHTFIAYFDSASSEIWVRQSDYSNRVSVKHCTSDHDGNLYFTGFQNNLVFGTDTAFNMQGSLYGSYLVKFNNSGNELWLKNIRSEKAARSTGITTDPCNDVWICGNLASDILVDNYTLPIASSTQYDVFLMGFSSIGHIKKAKTLGIYGSEYCQLSSDYKGNLFLNGDIGITEYYHGTDSILSYYEHWFGAKYHNKLGTDTLSLNQLLCLGDSLLLKAPSGFDNYLWNTGATSDSLMVHNAGTDIVTGNGLCIYLADTFMVINNPPSDSSSMKSDSFLCANSSILLQSSTGFTQYYWNTTSLDTILLIIDTGIYWVLCKSGKGCDALVHLDSFRIMDGSKNLHFSFAADTVACTAFSYYLPNNGVNYLWQDGSNANSFLVAQTGNYSFIASQYGCTFKDSLSVIIPTSTISPADTTVCAEAFTQIKLHVQSPNTWQYTWNTGSTGNDLTVTDAGTYFVVRTYSVCVATDTFRVRTEACGIIVHDAITPNGDGINDSWVVEGIDKYPNNSVQVFDKWGNLVYQKSNYANDWGGMQNNGDMVPDGTYYYVVKLNAIKLSQGEQGTFAGALLVKR